MLQRIRSEGRTRRPWCVDRTRRADKPLPSRYEERPHNLRCKHFGVRTSSERPALPIWGPTWDVAGKHGSGRAAPPGGGCTETLMVFARRTALLRFTILAALAVSAVLTVDHLKPGRAFCPLAEACAAASGSALGTILGVPTSVLGMLAFGGLFLLSLLPVEWARPLLRPAGLLAALAGLGFIAYQARVLGAYCPLCLVADGAGFVAGVITFTWPVPPIMRSGRRLPGEPSASRIAWSLGAALALVVPFAIPRPVEPAWVEITPLADVDADYVPAGARAPEPAVPPAPTVPEAPPMPLAPTEATGPRLASQETPTAPSSSPASVTALHASPISMLAAPTTPPPPPPLPPASPAAAPALAEKRTPSAQSPTFRPPPSKQPLLVEYLNAFCPHCRATHRRLHKVLTEMQAPMRKRRIYTWASKDYPLWARACAFAQTAGCEEQMFRELLRARDQSAGEVYAAARRAGLDVGRMRLALKSQQAPPRLVHDRRLVQKARIRKLPTLDIGRRRLMGEQSEAELRDAIRVALTIPQ